MDVISSHGVIVANPQSGAVEKVESTCKCGECFLDDILKFDVAEYRKYYNAELPDTVDIITNSTATEYEFLTSEGVLPVYRSKEKYFVIRTSQSSGAVYRQYLNLGVIKGRLSKCE